MGAGDPPAGSSVTMTAPTPLRLPGTPTDAVPLARYNEARASFRTNERLERLYATRLARARTRRRLARR